MAGLEPTPLSRSLESRVVPWIVLAISLAVTLIVWLTARLEVKRQDNVHYERLKERVLGAMERQFQSTDQALQGGRALVQNSDGELSSMQWSRYVDAVWPFLKRGAIGLGFVERVSSDQIESVEARLKAGGRLNFTAERSAGRSQVFLVTHLEPSAQNAAAVGTDLGANADVRAAAEQAMRTGAPTLTRP